MKRRDLLVGAGLTVTTGLAGCSALADSGGAGVVLTHVELGNASGEPCTFHLLVEYDDEITHWSSHYVGAGDDDPDMGDHLVELDAPEEPGETVVHARVNEQRTSVSFDTDEFDGQQAIATVIYGPWQDDDGEYALRAARHVSDRPEATEPPEAN